MVTPMEQVVMAELLWTKRGSMSVLLQDLDPEDTKMQVSYHLILSLGSFEPKPLVCKRSIVSVVQDAVTQHVTKVAWRREHLF